MKNNNTTLSKFLQMYLFLDREGLSHLRHEDVIILFPNLRRCSFDKLRDHPDMVENREVIFVDDGRKVLPYYIPEVEGECKIVKVECEVEKEEKYIEGYHDYLSMSDYELKCLLENKKNKYKNRMKAKEELEERGIIRKKKYKRNKTINYEEE